MDLVSEVQSLLKKRKLSVSGVVKAMDIGRNTFYYQLKKAAPDEVFTTKFKEITEIDITDVLKRLKENSTNDYTNTVNQTETLIEPKSDPMQSQKLISAYERLLEKQEREIEQLREENERLRANADFKVKAKRTAS